MKKINQRVFKLKAILWFRNGIVNVITDNILGLRKH